MGKRKLSGPAIFMYSGIAVTALLSAVLFALYYCNIFRNVYIYWCGVVVFMVFYHFGLRIFMGELTKLFDFDYNHPWFKERGFEKKLYKLLKVRKWKDKVLTFEPENFDFKKRTLEQVAQTMAKSETDHWINELISLLSIPFAFIFGGWIAFIVSAVAAMLFDAQFIIVQRYNRPIVLRLDKRLKARAEKTAVV